MKKNGLFTCLLLAALLSLAPAQAVFAEAVFGGDQQALSGSYDATVFQAGSAPVCSADIKGLFFSAGNTVSVTGSSEYALIAGVNVAFDGSCSRDAFAGGNNLSFTGTVERDLYAAGSQLDLRGRVGRDLFAAGKTVILSGEIGGDVLLDAESVRIADGAKIGGRFRCNSGASIEGPSEILSSIERYEEKKDSAPAQVTEAAPGQAAEAAPGQDPGSAPSGAVGAERSKTLISELKSRVFSYIGLLLIAFFLLWLTPLWEKVDEGYTGKGFGRYAAAFGIGFAVLAALPVAAILLMITGIGLRPAFVLLLICAAVLIASPVFTGFFLGALLWRRVLRLRGNYWAELAIGLLIWRGLSLVPYLGFVIAFITGPLALGVLTCMLGRKKKALPDLKE